MVSVILPTYNMGHYLPGAIESVQRQKGVPCRLIVIDDGSIPEENKRSSVAGPPSVSFHLLPHGGKAKALNYGMTQSKGDYICFLDADDLLPPGSLELRKNALEEEGAELVIGAFQTLYAGRVTNVRVPDAALGKEELIRRLIASPKAPVHLNAAMARRRLIERTGTFDERYRRGQDKDYLIRLIRHAQTIAYLEQPVYSYRRYRRPRSVLLSHRLSGTGSMLGITDKHYTGLPSVRLKMRVLILALLKGGYELLFGGYRK